VPVLRRSALACVLVAAALVPLTAQTGPPPAPTGLTPDVLALACAPQPAPAGGVTLPPLRLTGGQDTQPRDVFAPGDLVTVNAGDVDGLQVGDEFFVRRLQQPEGPRIARDPVVIRTAGWIRIWATDHKMSLATITYACDTLVAGDYLEPLALPVPVVPDSTRADAERHNYGLVLVGNDRSRAFATGDFFLVDRGSDHGLEPGSQLVLYRNREKAGNFLFEIGEAVAVRVTPTQSTLQVTVARDALLAGDLVALRRENPDE